MNISLDYIFISSLDSQVKNPTIHKFVLSSEHKTTTGSEARKQNTSSIKSIQYKYRGIHVNLQGKNLGHKTGFLF